MRWCRPAVMLHCSTDYSICLLVPQQGHNSLILYRLRPLFKQNTDLKETSSTECLWSLNSPV